MKLLILFCAISLFFSINAQAGLARLCVEDHVKDCHILESMEHNAVNDAEKFGGEAQSCTSNCQLQPITERPTCLQDCVVLDGKAQRASQCAKEIYDRRMQLCAFSQKPNNSPLFLCSH